MSGSFIKWAKSSFMLMVILVACSCIRLYAQADRGLYLPQYHYDENHRIRNLKSEIKKLKDKSVQDKMSEESKEKYNAYTDSVTDATKELIDSLEDLEDDKITAILNRINTSSHFEFEQAFTNKNYFYGRPSIIVGSCYTPSLTYKSRPGFYTSYSMCRYPEDQNITAVVPEWNIAFGYKRTFFRNFFFDANYDHAKLNYGSPESQSLLANMVSVLGNYDFDILCVGANFVYLFGGPANAPVGEKRASQITLSVDKGYYFNHFLGSYYFSIDPQFNLDLGSDNFFQIRNNLAAENVIAKKKSKNQPVKAPKAVETSFWGLLAIDAVVDFNYTIRNFDFYVTPHFAVPYHVLDENNVRTKSAGPLIFYLSAGINYRFRLWNQPDTRKSLLNH